MCPDRVCLVASRNLLDLEHSQKVPSCALATVTSL